MEWLDPRELDPDRINPDPDAEPIAALTFLLELPHCLRIDDAAFLVSDHGGCWPGWNPDAIGHMAGFSVALNAEVKPRYRVEVKQTRIDGWKPLAAAEQSFPGWEWEGVREKTEMRGVTARGAQELRTTIHLTVYELASDTPLNSEEDDEELFRHETLEWLSRRLDEALVFLNDYVVILAGLHDEWHISSLSRIDLPRDAPWKLTIFPTPDGWSGPSGTLDVHATIRDDMPETRPGEEVASAINAVHEARAGRLPFFQFVEHYQAAEHHLGSGRHDQSVVAACTATEVLINTLFRLLGVSQERNPQEVTKALGAPFRNQLEHHLAKFLGQEVALTDESSSPGRWYTDCYLLRNRVVHEGHKATAGEAYDSKVATGAFVRWMGVSLGSDPRTDWIKEFLQAKPPERPARGWKTATRS